MLKSKERKIQVISLLISSILGIIINIIIGLYVPHLFSKEGYADYKIYTFYLGFIPLIHLGLVDGILIKFSKYSEKENQERNFKKLLIHFSITQIIISFLITIFTLTFLNISFSYLAVVLTIPLINILGFYNKILVLCNKFKVIALVNLLFKIILFIFVILMMIFGTNDYKILILATIIAYVIQLLVSLLFSNQFLRKASYDKEDISYIELLKIGFPILLAYIISTFILGLDRMFIEYSAEKTDYAIYAFAYSLITIFLTVLNSVNVIVFPSVMKMDNNKRNKFNTSFLLMRDFLLIVSVIAIILLGPALNTFLPKYNDSKIYFLILFPIVFLRLDYSLRLWPQMNAFGKTFTILIVNLSILMISIGLNLIVLIYNLDYIYYAVMTVISTCIWNLTLEFIVSKKTGKKINISHMYIYSIIVLTILTYYNFTMIKYLILVAFSLSVFILINNKLIIKKMVEYRRKRELK